MLIPFSPPPGLNSDDTTFAAEGRWADGNNVRFHDGKAQVVGGYDDLVSAATLGAITGTPRAITYRSYSNQGYGILGTNTRLYIRALGGAWGASLLTVSVDQWAFADWGSNLMILPAYVSPAQPGTLYEYTSSAGTVAAVTGAPTGFDMLVTQERQILIAGAQEEVSGTTNRMCIRGCDLEDSTDWTTTSSNNAFEHILEGGGKIVALRQIGQYVGVWTDRSLHIGTFVGDPAQTYRFDIVASGCGAINAKCVLVINQIAYWMTQDLRFYAWQVGAQPVQLDCPIHKEFSTNCNLKSPLSNQFLFMAERRAYDEVWLHYPDLRDANGSDGSGAAKCTRYVAFNTKTGQWFRGVREIAGAVDRQDFYAETSKSLTFADSSVLSVDYAGVLYSEDVGATANGSAMNWHIQSADQYIDNGHRRLMIRGIVPDFEGQIGDVSLTLYMRDRPQSTAVTKGPYTLTTASTKKDFRASGKVIACKFSGGAASGSYARFGKPTFDAVPTGER